MPAPPQPAPYAIVINGRKQGDAVLLSLPNGRLLISGSDCDRWSLERPGRVILRLGGEPYFALDQSPGHRMRMVTERQELWLDFDATAFTGYRGSASPDRRVEAQRPDGLGSFFNYDLVANRQQQGNLTFESLGLLPEIGLFGPWGVFTGQWIASNLVHAPGQTGGNFVRLDSSFRHDDPERLQTLEIGDAVGGSGLVGRPVRFGGLRWSRNFGTQPGFVTLPRPALSGETALPSVLDVYIDGVRRLSRDIPPGPFEIDSLPVLTGRGDVELVVRDLLGREQRISQSYFTGSRQLRGGLTDFSYEAGFLRESFGRRGEDYGDPIAAGTHRHGFSNSFTGEARIELQSDRTQTGSLGGIVAVPYLGVFSGAVAASHDDDAGFGRLGLLSFERSIRRGVSFGVRAQLSTTEFRQLGLSEPLLAPRRLLGANLGISLRRGSQIGVGYVEVDSRTPNFTTRTVNASFSARVQRLTMSLFVLAGVEPREDYTALLTLSLPLAQRDYGTTGYRLRAPEGGERSGVGYLRLQRNLPQGEGWGYRAEIGQQHGGAGNEITGQLGLAMNAPYASIAADAARSPGDLKTYRLSVSGGAGGYEGHGFVSRKITNSFAIVETGVANLDLLVHNQRAARTDASGVAVVPYLQPYQRNSVRIDSDQLPLDVEIRTQQAEAAPYYRSAVLLALPVRVSRSAVLSLQLPDGSPVPAGATVHREDGSVAPVGHRGQVFLENLPDGDTVADVRWPRQHCQVRVHLPADAGVQPDLGVLRCEATP